MCTDESRLKYYVKFAHENYFLVRLMSQRWRDIYIKDGGTFTLICRGVDADGYTFGSDRRGEFTAETQRAQSQMPRRN